MSLRTTISAVLFPIFASTLFGVGVVTASLLSPANTGSFASVALAALALSVPLSREAAPLLASAAERQRIDDGEN